LPLADDMPGAPLEQALDDDFLRRHPAGRVATYEGKRSSVPRPQGAQGQVEEEMLARLRALGYLSPEAPLASAPVASGGTVSANYHANLGNIFAGRGELDRARREFQEALEVSPGHLGASGGLIQLDINQGRLEAALETSRQLVIQDLPGMNPALYFITAYLFTTQDRVAEGLAIYRDLVRHRPGVSQLFTGLGVLESAGGRVEAALEAYRHALDLDPAALYALQELYTLETGRGQVADVPERIARAIEAAPDEVMPYNWRGLILRRLGRPQEAEASFRRALEVDPTSTRTLVNLSSLLVDGGRPDEAVPLLRRILRQEPGRWEARVNLVVALGRGGKLAEAEAAFQGAEAGGGAVTTELLNAMAFAYYLNGSREEARTLLERSLALKPAQTEARRLLDELGSEPAPEG
jgi:tetratricopeptide (TPR) repeat protein